VLVVALDRRADCLQALGSDAWDAQQLCIGAPLDLLDLDEVGVVSQRG
jgi:hypothetical protein